MIKRTYILILISVLGVIFFNYEIKNRYHHKQKDILLLVLAEIVQVLMRQRIYHPK